jgi:drug/metabolite transporter (DMT)-like permease
VGGEGGSAVSGRGARLLVVAAALLFSTGGAGIKVEAFDAAQVSALRSGIAAIALALWLRGRLRLNWRILAAGVVYAAMLSLFVASTKLTTAANAIFLQSTAPLYLLVLAPLFLAERFRPRDLLFLVVLAVGTVFCFAGESQAAATAPNPALGDLLGAASGLVWALTLLVLRGIARTDSDGTATIGVVVAGNALACVAALPIGWPLPAATAGEWATVVYLGVFQIGLAYICLSRAVGRLPALETSLLLLLEPVLNPVWTWLVRGEKPGVWTVAGGAIIIGATALRVIYEGRREGDPGYASASQSPADTPRP